MTVMQEIPGLNIKGGGGTWKIIPWLQSSDVRKYHRAVGQESIISDERALALTLLSSVNLVYFGAVLRGNKATHEIIEYGAGEAVLS